MLSTYMLPERVTMCPLHICYLKEPQCAPYRYATLRSHNVLPTDMLP